MDDEIMRSLQKCSIGTPSRCWLEKWYWTWRHHHSDQHHHDNHDHDHHYNDYNHNNANKYRQGQGPANGVKSAPNMSKKGSSHATFTRSFESCNKKDEPLLHFGVTKIPCSFLGVSSIMWNHEALMLWLAISKRIGAHGRPVATIIGPGKKDAHLVAQRDLPAHMKVSIIPM